MHSHREDAKKGINMRWKGGKAEEKQWNDRNDIYCFAISFQRRALIH
jgi:hypothetical protein